MLIAAVAAAALVVVPAARAAPPLFAAPVSSAPFAGEAALGGEFAQTNALVRHADYREIAGRLAARLWLLPELAVGGEFALLRSDYKEQGVQTRQHGPDYALFAGLSLPVAAAWFVTLQPEFRLHVTAASGGANVDAGLLGSRAAYSAGGRAGGWYGVRRWRVGAGVFGDTPRFRAAGAQAPVEVRATWRGDTAWDAGAWVQAAGSVGVLQPRLDVEVSRLGRARIEGGASIAAGRRNTLWAAVAWNAWRDASGLPVEQAPRPPWLLRAGVIYAWGGIRRPLESRSAVALVSAAAVHRTVELTVVDAVTHAPVRDARVSIGFVSASPVDEGMYRADVAASPSVTATVVADGYRPRELEFSLVDPQPLAATVELLPQQAAAARLNLRGALVDGEGRPLGGYVVDAEYPDRRLPADPQTGSFAGYFAPARYELLGVADGYEPAHRAVTLGETAGGEIVFVLRLKPAAETSAPKVAIAPAGDRIEVHDVIRFAFDSAHIEPQSFAVLNRIADLLAAHADVHISIGGHTDEVGTAEYNIDLSRARAASVAAYLESVGVARARMRAIGYGNTRPLCTERSDTCRERNRRVEFLIE